MLALPYLAAAASSSTIRIFERFLSISKGAEQYLDGKLNFEQATDNVVKYIHIYVPLTTSKLVCDTIVLSMTGRWIYDVVIFVRSIFKDLLKGGIKAFINGIQLSLKHFFESLRNCTIALVLTQFKYLYDKQKTFLSSISLMNFCNICNQIYFLIIGKANGFTRIIQLELTKYWLECMGIIRTIAEANNINFVKYMNQSCAKQIEGNNDHAFDFNELQWAPTKDPDFFRILKPSLEDIYHGKTYTVIVRREIRANDKRQVEIEEVPYTVTVEPGCPDRKEFRFTKAGHRDPINIPADLVVKIEREPHQLYERSGSNLIYTAKIPLDDALHGTPIQVPSIDGNMMECNPHGSINPKTTVEIDHAGLPDSTNDGIRGRLIVKFDIEFPDTKIGTEPIE